MEWKTQITEDMSPAMGDSKRLADLARQGKRELGETGRVFRALRILRASPDPAGIGQHLGLGQLREWLPRTTRQFPSAPVTILDAD